MSRIIIPLVLAILGLVAVFGLLERAYGQGPSNPAGWDLLASETQGESVREIYAPSSGNAPQEPNIGFIDSPTANCYMPDPSVDACFINWYYLSVNASPNYMIAMTATLNAYGPVMRTSGFFQTSMYVPYNMLDQGFKVPCGDLGAGGHPQLGNAYAYTIRARDSANLKSANYGTVYCPAFVP